MNNYPENNELWNRMRGFASEAGLSLYELDSMFGLEEGMLEYMAENGVIPEDEILRRFSLFCGRSSEELVGERTPERPLDVRRTVFVLKGMEFVNDYTTMENVINTIVIDRPQSDPHRYVGVKVNSDSMSRAHILRGDTVLLRRQAIAEDGDIVAAKVEGRIVLRRYHRLHDIIWLEAEGPADDGPVHFSESLYAAERSITIYGKVISTIRFF